MQINNLNEDKKDRAFEIEMLQGIQKDLEFTEFLFNIYIDRLSTIDSTMTILTKASEQEEVSLDSIYPLFYYLSMGIEFKYPKGSYEALKNTGVNKITNDSLRYLLSNVYDFWLPFTEDLLDDDRKVLMPAYSWKIFFNHQIVQPKDGIAEAYKLIPIDDKILTNQKFIKYITSKQEYARYTKNDRMKRVNEQISSLKKLIDEELIK